MVVVVVVVVVGGILCAGLLVLWRPAGVDGSGDDGPPWLEGVLGRGWGWASGLGSGSSLSGLGSAGLDSSRLARSWLGGGSGSMGRFGRWPESSVCSRSQ